MAEDNNKKPLIEVFDGSQGAIGTLSILLNSTNNPNACAAYGDGKHCDSEASIQRKITAWAPRATQQHDLKCYLFFIDDEPVAFLNSGLSGTPATVKSTVTPNKMVSELSGLFIKDCDDIKPCSWDSIDFNGYMIERLQTFMSKIKICHIDETTHIKTECGALFVTFKPGHDQETVLAAAGFKQLTTDSPLALHPERFKFVDEQLFECTKTDKAKQVQHEGWHDSNPCLEWTKKEAMFVHLPGSDKETTLKSDIGA